MSKRSASSSRSPAAGTGAAVPESPAELPATSWWASLKRTVVEFKEDNLTDLAAGLTYYAVLSIFPALLVLVSLLGLAGQSATDTISDQLSAVAPDETVEIVTGVLTNLQANQATASLVGLLSLALAVWSASAYVAAFMRAANIVYDIREGRPFWKTLPVRVGITLLLLTLVAISALAVILSGGVAQWVGNFIGAGPTAVTLWNIVKWPVLVLLMMFMVSVLYWAAPNVKRPFRWVSPGGIVAVLIWLGASAAFAFYVANFANYNRTYGSLAAVVIFLVWLWISNIAILLGIEYNAEIERSRALQAGQRLTVEPYVEPRDVPKPRPFHHRPKPE
ncbi:ribonuclease BN [Thermobifida fusca YX]|jgi:membrane protein|uniref:Ribonuclease BN n=1 Tax=Thermobifida fusca (strain YX) TaxID=269800 RepID=Q47TC8_THEFY|nr:MULTISPECIES: YihY/virulence factor BrkB family protein [Thermobifida]AAZ54289.1 ribonuclease BN [Thermobifida fusca YX]MBO2529843.1 YihY/virulence factor BrkB family protein [Thermobifida sp.]MDD6790615.1 YihY/virulence factor BrkB family protein [Thermobifida fusca]PPS94043.1 ribonuclease [Thermobifida fusca]PZN64579.1 MAG: YihY/virulence factor BrkB family protein [Thermobifida fusca]